MNQLRRYILGESPPNEQEQIEEAYFTDPALQQELWDIFDEIAESFQHNELTATEAEQFAARLQASPLLRDRAENLTALWRAIAAQPKPQVAQVVPAIASPWKKRLVWLSLRWVAATVAIIGVMLTGYWLLSSQPKPSETAIANASPNVVAATTPNQNTTPSPQAKVAPSIKPSPKQITPVIATFFLPQESIRAQGDAARLTLPAEAKVVELQLEVRAPFSPRYQVEVQTASGVMLSVQRHLLRQQQREASFIKVQLPAAQLDATNYVVKITGQPSDPTLQPPCIRSFQFERK